MHDFATQGLVPDLVQDFDLVLKDPVELDHLMISSLPHFLLQSRLLPDFQHHFFSPIDPEVHQSLRKMPQEGENCILFVEDFCIAEEEEIYLVPAFTMTSS